MATGTNGIATWGNLASKFNISAEEDNPKCPPRYVIESYGLIVVRGYANTQLVKLSDISMSIVANSLIQGVVVQTSDNNITSVHVIINSDPSLTLHDRYGGYTIIMQLTNQSLTASGPTVSFPYPSDPGSPVYTWTSDPFMVPLSVLQNTFGYIAVIGIVKDGVYADNIIYNTSPIQLSIN